MKVKLHRDHFLNGLTQVLNVVGTRATMPILSNVLIEARPDGVCLTTTNLDLGIRCAIKAEVLEPGSITLPVRKLATIVKELPSLDVRLESTQKLQATLVSGGSRFKIMGLAPEDYPPLPAFDEEHAFVMKQEELSRLLKLVSYAASTDESRYQMNSVFFDFTPGKLSLVATDGRRLALASHEMAISEKTAGKIILPLKTVMEVERLLGQGETVKVTFNNRQVAFAFDTKDETAGLIDKIMLVSKLIEGKYPDYNQVLPKETYQRIKLDRVLFTDCVKRVSLVTTEKNNSVKVHISSKNIEISGSSPDFGEAQEAIGGVAYDGPEVSVAFNPQYILDPLRAVTSDEVFLEFKDELSPGILKTLDKFLCVVMPLRLS
jgi:DNA polymerase III subunit beta